MVYADLEMHPHQCDDDTKQGAAVLLAVALLHPANILEHHLLELFGLCLVARVPAVAVKLCTVE